MRAKDVLDVCEQLEFMAMRGRELAARTYPEAEVPIQRPEDRGLLFIFEWVWAIRPEAKR